MSKKGKEQRNSWISFVRGIVWGCLWALLICICLLLVYSIGISCGFLSEKYMQGYVCAACALGCFVGGLVGASRCGSRILLVTMAAGATMFILQFAAGIIFCNKTNLLEGWAYILCADLVGGAAAGLVYGKKEGRRKASSRR